MVVLTLLKPTRLSHRIYFHDQLLQLDGTDQLFVSFEAEC